MKTHAILETLSSQIKSDLNKKCSPKTVRCFVNDAQQLNNFAFYQFNKMLSVNEINILQKKCLEIIDSYENK